MNDFRFALLALSVVLGAARTGFAAGTTAAEFLRFGPGGPAASRSDAGGAAEQGITGAHFNPAGLASCSSPELYGSHRILPETLRYDFLGFATPLPQGRGTLAYSLQVLSQSALPKVDKTGAGAGDFSALDQAHSLSWARPLGWVDAGGSLRFIRQSIDGAAGSAIALDLGVHGRLAGWKWGLAAANIGQNLKLAGESSPLPLALRFGASRRLLSDKLLGAADGTIERGYDPSLRLGATYRAAGPISVGIGYALRKHDNDGPSGLATGMGLEIGDLRIDFAFRPFGAFGNSFQLGAGYRFGRRTAPPPRPELPSGEDKPN